MKHSPQELYLDLLKKTLSFSLWPEPPVPIDMFSFAKPPAKRVLTSAVSKVLGMKGLQLCARVHIESQDRMEGRVWPSYAHTMVGTKRLDNLQACIEAVLKEDVAGDLIETGVWRGGACILMRGVLAAYNVGNRTVYVADSFEGLPKPDASKHPADAQDQHHTFTFLQVSQEQVEQNFASFGLLDDHVVFLKGWFKDTLPSAPINKLAVLRLDGDMYGSTFDALNALYPKLQPGGFCIVDDYALAGCREAVTDYRRAHSIVEPMERIDSIAVYWRKK